MAPVRRATRRLYSGGNKCILYQIHLCPSEPTVSVAWLTTSAPNCSHKPPLTRLPPPAPVLRLLSEPLRRLGHRPRFTGVQPIGLRVSTCVQAWWRSYIVDELKSTNRTPHPARGIVAFRIVIVAIIVIVEILVRVPHCIPHLARAVDETEHFAGRQPALAAPFDSFASLPGCRRLRGVRQMIRRIGAWFSHACTEVVVERPRPRIPSREKVRKAEDVLD